MSDDAEKILKATTAAVERLGKAVEITADVTDGVKRIVKAAEALAVKRGVDVKSLLIGDQMHDAALLNAAAVQGEIQASGFDWAALPGVIFEIAFEVIKFGGLAATLL